MIDNNCDKDDVQKLLLNDERTSVKITCDDNKQCVLSQLLFTV